MTAESAGDVLVRPMSAADAPAGQLLSYRAFHALDVARGRPGEELTDALVQRGRARITHLQATDPDGCWTAEVDGAVAGIGLALRRGPMWFLSLLTVDPDRQSLGLGRRLLEATLTTAGTGGSAWLLSSPDARALRSYQRAGFALLPGYTAKGPVDRSLLPAVSGVRVGAYPAHGTLVEDVLRHQRGAPAGPDLDHLARQGSPLLVTEGPHGRGFVVLRPGGVGWLAATTEDAARRLLWSALAESTEPSTTVDWLTADQQWAVGVCLDARLPLSSGPSLAVRARPGPLSPYLPNGAFG